ncbi:MAG: uracil-DNA glycosylase [Candidatus Moraniibacteriota bacterium]|nr:MAG: uracil-DNA glycosylase [Candidatus Moranbacteria bacterium]
MRKAEALTILNTQMILECPCSLRATAIQAVPGEGNAEADILFIGEAPGKNEDEQGKPFVGAAGKFLAEMLASIHLKREDIYITNIVKYRPPNNRDPEPEEIEDCKQWLHEQIKIIEPKIIVTLGRHALEHFIPGKKISEVHGQAFRRHFDDIGEQIFFALYHPAAALYNGSMRQTLMQDFQKIPKVIAKLKKGL